MMKNFLILIFLISFSCSEKKQATAKDYLGIVNIEVSGSEAAIPHFEKGLLLLHSFEYSDSRESFLKAQEADPNMLMAYWGEAMTYNHPLWTEQDFEEGTAALEKLNQISENVPVNELEKDFIKSVHILYESDSLKTKRDDNYAEFMSELYKKYPDNHEVAAFYALSLLGSVSDGRDETLYGQGAKIVSGILKENPNHPGALHYLIHSYDDPGHAQLALSAADSYSVVAPDASHALHMPSHIYVALGMWDKVVSSNENSYQASLNRMERKNLAPGGRGLHAFHWLEYGYLQQNRVEEAKKMVLDLEGYVEENPSKYYRSHLVFLKGTDLVESEDWNSEVSKIPVTVSDLNVSTRSQFNFIEGMVAFNKKDPASLEKAISAIKQDLDKERYLVTYEDAPFCSGANRYATSPSMLLETEIMLYQLMALQSWMNDDSEGTESYLKKSIEIEKDLSYSYGPPVIQKPTTELYADWLFSQSRIDEALHQYEATLIRAPKRLKALNGKALCKKNLIKNA
jgi:tetratricopeptide (TPR) repeat protein